MNKGFTGGRADRDALSPLFTSTYVNRKQGLATCAAIAIIDLMTSLLTTSNPKTQKGVKYGWLSAIMHLSPSYSAGVGNMCPDASPQCIRFCLNKAGRGGIFKKGEKTNAVQEARKFRTHRFVNDRREFMWDLDNEINRHANKASRLGLKACVRLNGTSDIDWARITAYRASLFDRWSNVQFYDYTKSFTRMMEFLTVEDYPKNYHLTFSRSELNDDDCDTVLNYGGNVAVVFDSVPDSFRGRPVHNGDDSDLRFLDPKFVQGVWIGLKAKGKLARETSAFKVDALTACN